MNQKPVRTFLAINGLWILVANFAHPITPTVILNLQLGNYMFGVALASMMAMNFLFSPFWGKMNSYISSRTTLLICNCGYGAAQICFMLAKTQWGIILARMLAGAFCSGIMVSMLTYLVNTTTTQERGRVLAIQATLQGVASAFGFAIGGLLGVVSTNLTFLVQAAALVLCGILYRALCLDDSTLALGDIAPATFIKEVNPFAAFAASRSFLSAVFVALFGVAALQNLGFTAYEQSFNYYLRDQLGFSSAYNGVLKGIIGFITLAANLTICMYILRHTNVKRSLGLVFAGCTLVLGWVYFATQHIPVFILLNILYFALNAITTPLIQNLVAQRSQGAQSNLVMGFYNAVKSLGGIVGPLAAGFLYNAWPKSIFLFAGAVYLGAWVFTAAYHRLTRREEAMEEA